MALLVRVVKFRKRHEIRVNNRNGKGVYKVFTYFQGKLERFS